MRIVCTADGSHTLESSIGGECYHSINGALQEAMHVFIDAGLKAVAVNPLNILEVGFGTGLNALLTLLKAEQMACSVYYEAIEKYPIGVDVAAKLNYCSLLNVDEEKYFKPLYASGWDRGVAISDSFVLKKCRADILSFIPSRADFHLVYFDAFSADSQPELWSVDVFAAIYRHLQKGGILVTYSSKGLVKRNLRSAGFTVKRLEGAKGKRHMLRATK